MSLDIRWSGDRRVLENMSRYEQRVKDIIRRIAQYWQGVFEQYAKENAPWKDRTGNARQGLHAFIQELSEDTVRLYLSHGVDYGIYLETKYAARYAVIWPTIEAHLLAIRGMLQRIFG